MSAASQILYEGDEVMARIAPGEVVDGVISEVEGDRYTVTIFEGTVEKSVPRGDVWRNGYNFEAI